MNKFMYRDNKTKLNINIEYAYDFIEFIDTTTNNYSINSNYNIHYNKKRVFL